jgi:hypothetical protein
LSRFPLVESKGLPAQLEYSEQTAKSEFLTAQKSSPDIRDACADCLISAQRFEADACVQFAGLVRR